MCKGLISVVPLTCINRLYFLNNKLCTKTDEESKNELKRSKRNVFKVWEEAKR